MDPSEQFINVLLDDPVQSMMLWFGERVSLQTCMKIITLWEDGYMKIQDFRWGHG